MIPYRFCYVNGYFEMYTDFSQSLGPGTCFGTLNCSLALRGCTFYIPAMQRIQNSNPEPLYFDLATKPKIKIDNYFELDSLIIIMNFLMYSRFYARFGKEKK